MVLISSYSSYHSTVNMLVLSQDEKEQGWKKWTLWVRQRQEVWEVVPLLGQAI